MNSYLMIEKTLKFDGNLELGKDLIIKSNDIKVSIYNLDIQKAFISNKVYHKYLKLLKLVNFYLTSDDDTGTAYSEALNEIERFRQLVKNKYRAYLLEGVLKEMSIELTKKVKDAKRRLIFVETRTYDYTNENKHSK